MTDHKATKKSTKGYFFAILSGKFVFFVLLATTLILLLMSGKPEPKQLKPLKPEDFKVNWPSNMKAVLRPSPAIVALRAEPEGYPNVNIIEVPGEMDRRNPTNAILDSYRALGITDVTSHASSYPQTTELEFSSQGQEFRASVTSLDGGPERHFVLTYLDYQEKFQERRETLRAVMDEIARLSYHQSGDVQNGR